MSTAPDLEPDAPPLENAKPPFLRRVRIRNYKSIAFCDVTLEPLTILVGRNASGKSNFLDALGFLKDLVDMRVPDAVKARGGWNAIHRRADTTGRIEVQLEVTFGSYRSEWDAEYAVALKYGLHSQVQILRERLILKQRGTDVYCGYEWVDGVVGWLGIDLFGEPWQGLPTNGDPRAETSWVFPDPRLYGQPREDRLLLSLVGTQPFVDVAEGFRASLNCNFSPPAIRSWNPRTLESAVGWDGRDLATEIEMLREIEPHTVERIERFLSVMVDGVEGFDTAKYGDHERVEFRVRSGPGASSQRFDASSMSDGTLRILAALVAAHRIHLPTAASGFLGIEEPETSLHPAAVHALVDALDEATLRKQIILTTHSAEMIDNPKIKPENVRVVEMIDGQTVVAPVDEASVEIVKRKLDTLGGLERQNQLQANINDLDRQRHLSQNGIGPKE